MSRPEADTPDTSLSTPAQPASATELDLDSDEPLQPACPLRGPGDEPCEACQ